MSDERALLQEIAGDLQFAAAGGPNLGSVVYLEGTSDVPAFFALIGRSVPANDRHQNVLVKGPKARSGREAVRLRVETARRNQLDRVHGIVDGDGAPFPQLAPPFDDPVPGPLLAWKAYSIENLLAKAGWPPAWGPVPDWPNDLAPYAPYVAINRVKMTVDDVLVALDLVKYSRPSGGPLRTESDFLDVLRHGKTDLEGLDVEALFLDELARFRGPLSAGGLDEAHAMLNGKWLVDHFAPARCGRPPDACRAQWCDHVAMIGGDAEVKGLWRRWFSQAP